MEPASIVVGDNPGLFSYGANEESFRATGLMEAAGPYYRNIGNDSRKVDFNPSFMPSVGLSQAVLDADVIISLPKFKTHGLTVITGAIKNQWGCIGKMRHEYHLVLDDALSAVDTSTEEAILSGLRGVMRARTTFIVSHRVSSVKDADHIIVLDDGRIVERGTHESLVAHDGYYAELYRKQTLEEEIEEIA